LFPRTGLLIDVHLISQSKFCCDVQSKITLGIAVTATAFAVVERTHRVLVKFDAGTAWKSFRGQVSTFDNFITNLSRVET
jgi:hypothetical protein